VVELIKKKNVVNILEVPDWYCWCCHIKVTSFWFSQVTMSVVKSIVDL